MFALLLALTLQAGYARPELLVDTEWLAARTADPQIRIVDMRARGYDAGHIPGAVRLENDAIRTANRPPAFLPTAAEFEALMARLGISNTTRVIVYDDRGFPAGIDAHLRIWFPPAMGDLSVVLIGPADLARGEEEPRRVEIKKSHARGPTALERFLDRETFSEKSLIVWLATTVP